LSSQKKTLKQTNYAIIAIVNSKSLRETSQKVKSYISTMFSISWNIYRLQKCCIFEEARIRRGYTAPNPQVNDTKLPYTLLMEATGPRGTGCLHTLWWSRSAGGQMIDTTAGGNGGHTLKNWCYLLVHICVVQARADERMPRAHTASPIVLQDMSRTHVWAWACTQMHWMSDKSGVRHMTYV